MEIFVIAEKLPHYILWNDKYMVDGRKFAIGEGYIGQVVWNAAELPHGIVAGATGGGKTVLLRCLIHQAILKNFNVNVLDFKGGGDFSGVKNEYEKYNDIDRNYGNFIISEPKAAHGLLTSLLVQVRGRAADYERVGVSNIDEYNALGGEKHIPWLVVIDEAAEILDVKPKEKTDKELYTEIDKSLRTLARTSRSAGVHIVMGIIRPDSNVIDGQIKNNLLFRCCGYFADSAASRIVLDNDKATEISPNIKGRFIIGEEETQAYYLPLKND